MTNAVWTKKQNVESPGVNLNTGIEAKLQLKSDQSDAVLLNVLKNLLFTSCLVVTS